MKNTKRPPGLVALLSAGLLISFANSASADVEVVTPEDIDALVAENEGKVVVVNFWATWCAPCLREFPDIVEVYEDYRDQGLEVFAVSMNYEDEIEDIDAFLENFQPPFGIYRASEPEPEFYEAVIDSWYGEMPMTMVFDTAGNRVHVHKKPLTYEELAGDVAALIP